MKHIFLDMDGTITPSRSIIGHEMALTMERLIEIFDVIVVSGARFEQMAAQLEDTIESVVTLAQNGNDARESVGRQLWYNDLSEEQRGTIMTLLLLLRNEYPTDRWDIIEDRGTQISYSMLGHDAPKDEKLSYDPTGEKRREVIKRFQAEFDALDSFGIKYAIGGTTCIDFFRFTKGENVERYIKQAGMYKKDCVYVGDALYKGGNDESVLEVGIKCVDVIGPDHVLKWMRQEIINNDGEI